MTYILQNFTKLTLAAFLFTASLPAYCEETQEYDKTVNSFSDASGTRRHPKALLSSKQCSETEKFMILQGSPDDDKVWLKMTCTGPFDDKPNPQPKYKYEYWVICKKNINYSEFCSKQYDSFDTSEKIKNRLENPILPPS